MRLWRLEGSVLSVAKLFNSGSRCRTGVDTVLAPRECFWYVDCPPAIFL